MKTPFNKERFVGYVSFVSSTYANITFPSPKLLERFYYDGDMLQGGLVGNYIVIEGHGHGILAKTIEVELPDKTTTYKSLDNIRRSESHPNAKVEFQMSFDAFSLEGYGAGIKQYPEIGARAFACPANLISGLVSGFGHSEKDPPDDLLDLARIDSNPPMSIQVSANALLSRHCAITGTTGSGKSYTLGKLIEEMCKKSGTKILLIDATGEFSEYGQDEHCKRMSFGENGDTYFPYQQLTESDLFVLFRPSQQTQEPILRQAIRSLKIAKVAPDNDIVENGLIEKAGRKKIPYTNLYNANIDDVENPSADFDIKKLTRQIELESVWDTARGDPTRWGDRNESTIGHCSSLIQRIKNIQVKGDISGLFGFSNRGLKNLERFDKEFDSFYNNDNLKILVIDLSKISSEANARDIFSNAVGRYLLDGVRRQLGVFKEFSKKPLVFIIDEAHQVFEIEKIRDEFSNEFKLDSFEKLAKESRKFGLFLCLSTQRPADVPAGVLSQMGSFIAHRLINDRDIKSIRDAVQNSSSGMLSFLPAFRRGQALLTGSEFPMPIIVQTNKIDGRSPKSDTPVIYEHLNV